MPHVRNVAAHPGRDRHPLHRAYGGREDNEIIRDAADVACQELTRRITGKRPSDSYFRSVTKLGETLGNNDGWKVFAAVPDFTPDEILMSYKD